MIFGHRFIVNGIFSCLYKCRNFIAVLPVLFSTVFKAYFWTIYCLTCCFHLGCKFTACVCKWCFLFYWNITEFCLRYTPVNFSIFSRAAKPFQSFIKFKYRCIFSCVSGCSSWNCIATSIRNTCKFHAVIYKIGYRRRNRYYTCVFNLGTECSNRKVIITHNCIIYCNG